jgi:hypothetical protein
MQSIVQLNAKSTASQPAKQPAAPLPTPLTPEQLKLVSGGVDVTSAPGRGW